MKTKNIITIGALFIAGFAGEVVAEEYDAIPVQSTMQYVDDTGRRIPNATFLRIQHNSNPGWRFGILPYQNDLDNNRYYNRYSYFMMTVSISRESTQYLPAHKISTEWTIVNFGEVSTATLSVGRSFSYYHTIAISSYAFSVSSNVTATVRTITTHIPQLTASIRYRYNTVTLTAHKLIRKDYRHNHAEQALHNDYIVAGHNADNEKIVRCVVHTYGKGVITKSVWEATKLRRQISAELSKAENADMSVDGLCAWIVATYPNTPLPPTGEKIVALYRATLPQRPVDESPRGNDEDES